MVETVVGTNATSSAVAPKVTVQAGHAVSGQDGFTLNTAPETKQGQVSPLSPRLRFDPSSGIVITEFLDQNGGLQAQSPSNAVLAYLRVGLAADGQHVPSAGTKATASEAENTKS